MHDGPLMLQANLPVDTIQLQSSKFVVIEKINYNNRFMTQDLITDQLDEKYLFL